MASDMNKGIFYKNQFQEHREHIQAQHISIFKLLKGMIQPKSVQVHLWRQMNCHLRPKI